MALREIWDRAAQAWGNFAASPDHDHLYWAFHRLRFLDLLPPPGRLTVDLGAGEGRLTAELARAGHRVVAIDSSPAMVSRAVQRADVGRALVGDASRLPLPDSVADLAVAFMSLQDMDDPEGAIGEAWRTLEPSGRLCIALVHPINSGGSFETLDDDAAFTIPGSYVETRRYVDVVERDGLKMTFTSDHRSLEDWLRPVTDCGFLLERIREVIDPENPRWRRVPLFLHVRAVKP